MANPTEEQQLIHDLVDTATKLGKILHKRGGSVHIDLKLSGPRNKRPRRLELTAGKQR